MTRCRWWIRHIISISDRISCPADFSCLIFFTATSVPFGNRPAKFCQVNQIFFAKFVLRILNFEINFFLGYISWGLLMLFLYHRFLASWVIFWSLDCTCYKYYKLFLTTSLLLFIPITEVYPLPDLRTTKIDVSWCVCVLHPIKRRKSW